LLVNITHPPVHPVAVGEKVTFSGTLCPAGRLNGKLKLDTLNSVPLSFIAETVTLVCPPFLRTITSVSFCPIRTLPKRKPDGVHVNCCAAARSHKDSIVTNRVKVMM
jgi:hypothetical protein